MTRSWKRIKGASESLKGLVVELKGRLRAYGVALAQILRFSAYPPLLARRLLVDVLVDFRETGHHYLTGLIEQRKDARRRGDCAELEIIGRDLREYAVHEQIPQRWQLERLFSIEAYDTFGAGLIPVWALALVRICTLEQYWEELLLGLAPTNPDLLPGWSSTQVASADWLADLRPQWAAKLEVFEVDSSRPIG